MKKNMFVKIVFITLIFIIFFSLNNINIAGADFSTDQYKPQDLSREKASTVFLMGEKILGLLRNVATTTAILTIAVIGVKYVYASAAQKAEYKATLLPWMVGAILVVMVTGFLGIIQNLAQKI